jgi:hypothetical protein
MPTREILRPQTKIRTRSLSIPWGTPTQPNLHTVQGRVFPCHFGLLFPHLFLTRTFTLAPSLLIPVFEAPLSSYTREHLACNRQPCVTSRADLTHTMASPYILSPNTDNEFEQKLLEHHHQLVVLVFTTAWCKNCKRLCQYPSSSSTHLLEQNAPPPR